MRNILVSLVSLLVFFGAAELLSRALLPERDRPAAARSAGRTTGGLNLGGFAESVYAEPDPVLGYRLKRNHAVAEYRFNSLGYRGDDIVLPKPADTLRVVCLGGSTTIGSNAGDNRHTFPALLEAMFAATRPPGGKRVEVVNAGVFGYNSRHTRLRLKEELPALQPDVMVVMDGLNDVLAARLMSEEELSALAQDADAGPNPLLARSGASPLTRLDAVFENLAFYRVLRLAAERVRASLADDREGLRGRVERLGYAANTRELLEWGARTGTPTLLVNHPWIVRPGGPSGSVEADKARVPFEIDLGLLADYRTGREIVSGINQALSAESGAPLVDPQPLFDRLATDRAAVARYFSDSIHYTALGNYFIARTVYRGLTRLPAVAAALAGAAPATDEALDALFVNVAAWPLSEEDGCPDAPLLGRATDCPVADRVAAKGLNPAERDGDTAWRWALGPETTLRFNLAASRPCRLDLALNNPCPGQRLVIEINGEPLRTYADLPAAPWLAPSVVDAIPFPGRAGENVITFRFALSNHRGLVISEKDTRPLAAAVLALSLHDNAPAPP